MVAEFVVKQMRGGCGKRRIWKFKERHKEPSGPGESPSGCPMGVREERGGD